MKHTTNPQDLTAPFKVYPAEPGSDGKLHARPIVGKVETLDQALTLGRTRTTTTHFAVVGDNGRYLTMQKPRT